MPGMHSGLDVTNPVLVAAFRAALLRQGLTALLVLAALGIIWACLREWRPGLASRPAGARRTGREAPARRLLRLGFGALWVVDAVLQTQPAMAAGLPGGVMAPAASMSPAWVRHVVDWAGTAWSLHPVQAATASVWIQAGIGIWMLAAARGRWSRAAGLAGAAWGLLVWVFGEAFGGLFAPGLSVLFGAPGPALLYCAGGALIALPDRAWRPAAAGRRLLAGTGFFLFGMAVLQAWPGRGFWQGQQHGRAGPIAAMIGGMSGTPQPSPLATLVRDFGALTVRHGFAVNLAAVAVLALIGLALIGLSLTGPGQFAGGRPAVLKAAVAAAAVFCLADWVLVQDLGFLGGLGTDPNSMIPLLLLIVAGCAGVARPAARPAEEEVAPAAAPGLTSRLRPARLTRVFASASAAGLLAVWAATLVLLGAAPMAVAYLTGHGRGAL